MATLDQVRARLGQTDLPHSQAGLRDLALLSVLKPAVDPATDLSARQSTPEAARYRLALDRVLVKPPVPLPVERRPLLPSTVPLDAGEWGLEPPKLRARPPAQEFPGTALAPQYFQPLTEAEEQGFQRDYANYAAQSGLDPNPDDPRHAYNYRAWWRAMQQDPERFSPRVDPEDQKLHGPSLFKAADHPNRFVNVEGRKIDTITGQPRQRGGVSLADLRALAAPMPEGEDPSALETFYRGAIRAPAQRHAPGSLRL